MTHCNVDKGGRFELLELTRKKSVSELGTSLSSIVNECWSGLTYLGRISNYYQQSFILTNPGNELCLTLSNVASVVSISC